MEHVPERIFIKKKEGNLDFAMQITAGLVSLKILWVLFQIHYSKATFVKKQVT